MNYYKKKIAKKDALIKELEDAIIDGGEKLEMVKKLIKLSRDCEKMAWSGQAGISN